MQTFSMRLLPTCRLLLRSCLVLSTLLLLVACAADDNETGSQVTNSSGVEENTNGENTDPGAGSGVGVGAANGENGNNNDLVPANGGEDNVSEPPAPEPIVVLTEPPGADDEPALEPPEFNNAAGFEVYRDEQPRIPYIKPGVDPADEQAFLAGLPAAVISAPEGFDTSTNQPPFFSNLRNLDVFAGDLITLRFKPEDIDGELPGMYAENLPGDATFPDNFDGTRTFTWQPVQEDVGISRVTVIAQDASNRLYRSAQTVYIRVSMPDDPSTIINKAPTLIDLPFDYTVRVNDPVLIELRGRDANGTLPTLEIPDLPAGASLVPHPRFEETFVFKFTPTVVGDFTFTVLARDSVDTTLTSSQQVTINVLDRQAFQMSGLSLKQRAALVDKQIGFAARQSFYHFPDGAIYSDIAAREFDIVTPENSMKMSVINPLPGRFEFAGTDNLIRYAKLHDMTVHGHPLVWHRLLPEWVKNTDIAEREGHMIEFIDRVLGRYADDVAIWDVVNEPVNDDGSLRSSIWSEAMGEQYLDKALNRARRGAPDAKLLVNEYDINKSGPKFDGLLALIERLQQRQVALDGIGFQMHVFSSFSTFDELRQNFEAIAALGLEIYITELDVSIDGEQTEQALQQQADVYRKIASMCVEQAACKALQMWGFTDQYSFRSFYNPLPFDREYQTKPAYQALHEGLMGVVP